MEKYKVVAAALVTVSLVGTLTWTAFAAKTNFVDAPADNTSISTFSKNFKNLLSDDDSATEDRNSYGKKSSGFGFGIGMDSNLICEILGITKEELSQKLKDNDGNIYKILEDAGKVEEYKTAALAKCREELDKAVADGKLAQEKADEIYESMKEAINKFDGSTENSFRIRIGEKFNVEDMPGLEDLPEEWKNKIEDFKNKLGDPAEKIERFWNIADIDVICEVFGMTKEELSQKLKDNDGNIYKILEDAGKVDEYKAALLAKYKAELDKKVADGKITQEKADEMYSSMKEKIDNFDGNIRINFYTDGDSTGDKIREKFRHGAGEDFTFDFSEIPDNFWQRGNKDNGNTSASGLTVKDL